MTLNMKYSPVFSQVVIVKDHQKVNENEQESYHQQLFKDLLDSSNLTQTRDEMQNLQLIEFLKLEKEEDYTQRIIQIVETFQLRPINLDLNNQSKQTLIKSIVFQNQTIKQTDILIKKNYEVIAFKTKLYGASSIILKKYPPSNFQKDTFDMVVYSHKGQVLCSFYNFKKIDRLVKALLIRFRRLQKIFYLQNLQTKELVIDVFLEMKKLFNQKPKVLAIYQYVQKSKIPQDQQQFQNMQSTFQWMVNDKQMETKQFEQFCLSNSIVILQKQKENQSKQMSENLFIQISQTINKKQKFDKFILDYVCYGDKKKQQYRTKNQITIRFINYCHQKFLESSKNPCQITINQVKQFFENLIKEIQDSKNKLKQSHRQNKSNLIFKHFPRLMKRGARLCLHCKQKTRYLCIGCSVKHSTKVALCVLCFSPFHQQKNYYQHFPQIVKKSNAKFIPNLQKQVVYQNIPIESILFKDHKKQILHKRILIKYPIKNKIMEKNVKNQKRIRKIKKQFQGLVLKYKRMKSFVFHSYKKTNAQKERVQKLCKIQEK